MAKPLASVVVAVHADPRIHRLLDSLDAQTLPRDRYEVIVVENGSHDLESLADRAGVRYLHLPRANLPAARNAGVRAARSSTLLMTDADCVVGPNWVECLQHAVSTGSAAAVGGRVEKYRPETLVQRYAITLVDGQHRLNFLPALDLPYVVGANAGYAREHLLAVDGFDEQLLSGSDVDICYRLGLAGHRVDLAPQAVVYHDDRATVAAHFRRFAHYATYQVLLFGKYRAVSGKRWVLNPYPWRRIAQALAGTPAILRGLATGESAAAATALLQVVEACGVWWGDIRGSIRHCQLYL